GSLERDGWRAENATRGVDAVPANDAGTAAAPAYGRVDLAAAGPTIGWGAAELRVRAGASNVLDEAYVASVVVNAFGGRYFEPGPGRAGWVGLSVSWAR
ncbi:MAG: TonB-dependent receptor, partial [Gemmatimonadota bacterium]|nr:TonB-dependent receptor [Gemmatimonadota bacterium]